MAEHRNKRRRLSDDDRANPALIRVQRAAFLSSMSREVSPPLSARATPDVELREPQAMPLVNEKLPSSELEDSCAASSHDPTATTAAEQQTYLPPKSSTGAIALSKTTLSSPFSLTKIRDLAAASNVDTVSLHDILGNPLIKEAWIFNFCFDVNWMMQFFDPDVRDLVQIKIIHGSWKTEDRNRMNIEAACSRRPNVEAFKAYLPDQFGTHHSKMFILFTHDDQAEVIIHTANMLMKDWTNMTQAVWRTGSLTKATKKDGEPGSIGSGTRFKYDLLAYLKEYKKATQPLHKQLQEYDFSRVRGALVASVPSKIENKLRSSTEEQHLWGHTQLREVLSHVRRKTADRPTTQSHLVAQVSSIATLPNGWLDKFVKSTNPACPSSNTKATPPPSLSIIYPTPPNVAASLDGYEAGASIHTKAQSATHLAQINNLRPHLNQWTKGPLEKFRARRDKAAPHVKTYIQFNSTPTREKLEKGEVQIEWALLTSANLSTQAWGSLPRGGGEGKSQSKATVGQEGVVHIQSFEIGVLVWPELFVEDFGSDDGVAVADEDHGFDKIMRKEKGKMARMIPVFDKNTPEPDSTTATSRTGDDGEEDGMLTIGLRIPYDLPLTPYAPGELPWSPQGTYMTPDSRGGVWNANGR
jgi:tyrosyl-DNA phosphodiesterase 1